MASSIERGELPRGSDAKLILDLLLGVVQHYLLFINEGCSDRQIEVFIDLVLIGGQNGGARALKRAR